jgi:ABC-type branched-subunit amino acid transport system ATPase component
VATRAPLDGRITTHAILACRGLRKTFGELVAVDDIGFEIGSAILTAFSAADGAGKSAGRQICSSFPM